MNWDIGIVMIVPVLLFVSGYYMVKRVAVKEMPQDNTLSYFISQGYKTGGSMRSQATWEFANKHCGNLYMRFGVISFALGLLLLLILPDHRLVPELIVGGQSVFAVLPFGLTEKSIEQNFDRQGNRV